MKKDNDKLELPNDAIEEGIPDILKPTMDIDCRISTDPFGSWTGVPIDIFDTPVQDVDDL